ncbi:MAG: flagellar hook-associated protein 3 [Gammaproteobacteria bacterium]|nr:MAG: flagellar hook-associated protein 3 [Gammaproteobacteria bacterium]RLA21189.1 MAG: flagellar hook-associated protein 3 [Gammaproteobacteria bacterium]
MRISTSLISQLGINSILDQQSKLSKTQLQLATGKRILTPSDDPTGQTRLLDIRQSLETNKQYQDNIDTVRSRLTLEEATLTGVSDLLQRVSELAVQGVNDTQSAETRRGIEAEVRQLLGELLSLANKKNANGEHLFGGDIVNSLPFSGNENTGGFAYNGDTGQRTIQISETRRIADGDPGESVFGAVGGGASVFEVLFDFANDMNTNAPDPAAIDEIHQVLSGILEVRAGVGARLNALERQKEVNADFILDAQTAKSAVEDLDYAEATGRFNLESVALQAAQQAYIKVQGLSLFNFL